MGSNVYELILKNRILPIFRGVKKKVLLSYMPLLLDAGINTVEIRPFNK